MMERDQIIPGKEVWMYYCIDGVRKVKIVSPPRVYKGRSRFNSSSDPDYCTVKRFSHRTQKYGSTLTVHLRELREHP